jgi:ubiquinone/menaquinone biosynthesis C-methylase UbiE
MRPTNYAVIASSFDRRYQEQDYSDTRRALDCFLRSPTDVDVLEVGCGTGYWLTQLASPSRRMVGLDASAEMLHQASLRGLQLNLVHAVAEQLPLASATFDRIFCVNSLHHFSDPYAFVASVRRILRPGGTFITVGLDPHSGLDRWWIYDYFENALEVDRQRYMPTKMIREAMTNLGFTDCHTQVVQHIERTVSTADVEQGRISRGSTSQLAILTDEEYDHGIERIRADIRAAEDRGQDLHLISDLHLYATTCSVEP